MKAKVYEERCIGCGQCEATCDKVFRIGDEGYAEVVCENIPAELENDVRSAADGCPTSAIEIVANAESNVKADTKITKINVEEEKNAA